MVVEDCIDPLESNPVVVQLDVTEELFSDAQSPLVVATDAVAAAFKTLLAVDELKELSEDDDPPILL